MNKPKHSKLIVSLCVTIGVLEAPRKKDLPHLVPNCKLDFNNIENSASMTPVSTYQVSKKIKVWRTVNFNCVIIRSALKMKLLWYNTIKNCNKSFIMGLLLYLMAKTIETIFVQSFLILNIHFQHFPQHTFKWLPVLLKLFFHHNLLQRRWVAWRIEERREGGREGRNRRGQDRGVERQ